MRSPSRSARAPRRRNGAEGGKGRRHEQPEIPPHHLSADADVSDILAHTISEFGERQFELYWMLIDKAAQMVGEDPLRPSSRARDELGESVRSFHIDLASDRKGAASHVLYYIPGAQDDGTQGAIILRVLWDGMEPRQRVGRGLAESE